MTTNHIYVRRLAEINIHWQNNHIYSNVLIRFRVALKDSKVYINTSDTNVKWSRKYKPGGTATITNQLISDKTTSRFYDNPYGRWNTTIIGPPQHQIAIITAYIVCNTPIIPEKCHTAAYQQWERIQH